MNGKAQNLDEIEKVICDVEHNSSDPDLFGRLIDLFSGIVDD